MENTYRIQITVTPTEETEGNEISKVIDIKTNLTAWTILMFLSGCIMNLPADTQSEEI